MREKVKLIAFHGLAHACRALRAEGTTLRIQEGVFEVICLGRKHSYLTEAVAVLLMAGRLGLLLVA